MATIIVLDDVYEAGILIKRILQSQGHLVAAFTEEEEAVAYVRDNPVDLAILDIKLKKLTGVEVLAEMKKLSPGLKVMMLTGYPTLETAKESMKFGAGEYCIKPIDNEELRSKVAALLASPHHF